MRFDDYDHLPVFVPVVLILERDRVIYDRVTYLDMALCSQVVDFMRPHLTDYFDQARAVCQVTIVKVHGCKNKCNTVYICNTVHKYYTVYI